MTRDVIDSIIDTWMVIWTNCIHTKWLYGGYRTCCSSKNSGCCANDPESCSYTIGNVQQTKFVLWQRISWLKWLLPTLLKVSVRVSTLVTVVSRAVGELLVTNSVVWLVWNITYVSVSVQDAWSLTTNHQYSPVTAAVKEFFGSSHSCHGFMDQHNPLSGVSHKRRLILGTWWFWRDRARYESSWHALHALVVCVQCHLKD